MRRHILNSLIAVTIGVLYGVLLSRLLKGHGDWLILTVFVLLSIYILGRFIYDFLLDPLDRGIRRLMRRKAVRR